MSADLAALSSTALTTRLAALLADERHALTEFLLHLGELDRRRLYLKLGYPSLFEYLLRAHRMSRGAAFRRLTCARLLRRFPQAAPRLRDGRLSLTTLTALREVLDAAHGDEVLAAASGRTKEEVEALVAALRPRPAPRDAVRPLPPPRTVLVPAALVPGVAPPAAAPPGAGSPAPEAAATTAAAPPLVAVTLPPVPPPPVAPITAELRVLRVTVTAQFLADLEEVKVALARKYPQGRLGDLLGECVKTFLAGRPREEGRGGGSRGSKVAPEPAARGRVASPREDAQAQGSEERPAAAAAAAGPPEPTPDRTPPTAGAGAKLRTRYVPQAVRRAVWARDGGRCTFRGPDGTRCSERRWLELDHVEPWALGGEHTVANCQIRCKAHNLMRARETFGALVPERRRCAVSAGEPIAGRDRKARRNGIAPGAG